MDVEQIAYIVDNPAMQSALLESIQSQSNISLIGKTKVESISRDEENKWPVLKLSNGETIQARLLVHIQII